MTDLGLLFFALLFFGLPILIAWLKLEGRPLQLASLAWLAGLIVIAFVFQKPERIEDLPPTYDHPLAAPSPSQVVLYPGTPEYEAHIRALAAKGNPFAQLEVEYMDLPYEERAGIHFAPFLQPLTVER